MNFKLRSIHLFLILLAILILGSLGMNLKEGLNNRGNILNKITDGLDSGNPGKKGLPIKKTNGYNDSGSYSNDPLSAPSVSFVDRFGKDSGKGSDRTLSDTPKYDVNIDVKVSEDAEDDTTGAPISSGGNSIREGIADFVANQSTAFTDPNSSFLQQFGYTADTADIGQAPQPMTESSSDINDITYTAETTPPPGPPPPGPKPSPPGPKPPGPKPPAPMPPSPAPMPPSPAPMPPPPGSTPAYPGLPGEEDQWILKSQIVPPVCPACPPKQICDCGNKPAPPCPPCARCPEPAFKCAKVPNYNSNNDQYLPRPVLADFSQFGM